MELISTSSERGVCNFHGMDSIELYRKNLSNKPSDWVWRDKHVVYTLNSQGYRCSEWDRCNWSNSILVLGCSMVFGTGVSDNETLPAKLAHYLDIPTINLGQIGGSPMLLWANTVRLVESNITPRAVIYLWPQVNRVLHWDTCRPTEGKNKGAWTTNGFGIKWAIEPYQGLHYQQYATASCKLMWKCPVFNWSVNNDSIQPNIVNLLKEEIVDQARDLRHPGVCQLDYWAKELALELVKQGV